MDRIEPLGRIAFPANARLSAVRTMVQPTVKPIIPTVVDKTPALLKPIPTGIPRPAKPSATDIINAGSGIVSSISNLVKATSKPQVQTPVSTQQAPAPSTPPVPQKVYSKQGPQKEQKKYSKGLLIGGGLAAVAIVYMISQKS